MKLYLLVVIGLWLAVINGSAFAQDQLPLTPSLKQKLDLANAEIKAIDAKIEASATNAGGSEDWVCKLQILKLQKAYAEWFKENVSSFNESAIAIETAFANIRTKVKQLKTETITPVAVAGQKVEEIKIGYPEIVAYLKVLNGRVKSCSKDNLSLLMKEMKDPANNSVLIGTKRVHVGHDQILGVIQTIATNLNVSLRETKNSYEVKLVETECGYDLVVNAQIDAGKFGRKSVEVSMLSAGDFTPADAAKANTKLVSDQRVGKYSARGNLRYLEMHSDPQIVKASCGLPKWTAAYHGDLDTNTQVYVSFAEMDAEVTKLKAKQTSGVSNSSAQSALMKSLNVELRPSEYCRENSESNYFFRGQALYVDDVYASAFTCIASPQVVKREKDYAVFAVSPNRDVVFKSLMKDEWTQLTSTYFTTQIVASGNVDGKAAVAYVTILGDVKAVDEDGQEVQASRLPVPSSNAGPYSGKIEMKMTDYCKKQSVESRLDLMAPVLDGEVIRLNSCMTQIKAFKFYNDIFIFGINSNREIHVATATAGYTKALTSNHSAAKIISVDLKAGKPVVKYLDTQGAVYTVDLAGVITQ